MYIFELIAKLIKNNHTKKNRAQTKEIDSTEICSHTFLPIDSTGEILACSKCGLVVKSKDLKIKERNPFG